MYMPYSRLLFAFIAFITLCTHPSHSHATASIAEDDSKFAILAYSRIGEDHLPDQSLTRQQFDEHLAEIKQGDYNVISLPEALTAIENSQTLPDNTIVLTFDGAYKSAAEYAFPKLQAANVPFTVFYSADTLDRDDPEYTDWATLKQLAKADTATLATLPAIYDHIAYGDKTETLKAINRARQRHREEFKTEADYLAYPYGEYSTALTQLAQTQGYKAAFGLHSGVAHAGTDLFALPRFSMTERFGSIDRFRLTARAMPLPIVDLVPENMQLAAEPFKVGFTLSEELTHPISCFIDGEQQQNAQRLGQRIEIRPTDPLTGETRIRLNCTMQGPKTDDDEETWRWLGLLFHRAQQIEIRNPEPDELPQPQE